MRLSRSLCILELEQRIAPAHTVTLNAVTTFFEFTDVDGDTVAVTRDVAGVGTISVTDENATGAGDFNEINSIVFNAGCDSTTTLSVLVTESGVASDGIATVDYIDFTAPAQIGSIEIEGDILGTLAIDPVSVAVGDLNGDGHLDMAVANHDNNNVSVFLGSGDNTFLITKYDAGDGPSSIAIADLDGVNEPDLVVTNSDGNNVSVLLNNGDGTFAAKVDYGTGGAPASIAIADLDGVNGPDLAVANANPNDNNVSILLNNGDGTFAAKVDYGTGSGPVSIAIDDLDGVNNPDLVVANSDGNTVSVLINNGNGTFAAAVSYGTGDEPVSVAIDDLDGDGSPDLAVANKSSDDVSVLLNNGNGTFAASTEYDVGLAPESVCIADLDGDGSPDLAVANSGSDDISILFNDGGGAFAPFTGDAPVSVFSADLNADGNMDMVVANSNDNTVSVFLGRGNGTFAEKVDYTTANNPVFIAIADLSEDGAPDLAVACESGARVSILLNNGDGTFGPKTDYSLNLGARPTSLAIEDLDGDNIPDLAVASTGNWNVTIFLNEGYGTFLLRDNYTAGDAKSSSSIAIALLNNDDIPDLAVTNLLDHNVSIFLGEGTGTFVENATYNTGVRPESVAVGDLNGDDFPDLAVANWGDSTVSILRNNGNGTFAADPEVDYYDTGSRPLSVFMEDLDGDGDKDLAVANSESDTVSIFFNDGNAAFAGKTDYAVGDKPAAVSLTDLDGDDDFDLVVAAEDSDQVFVLFNDGNGAFGGAETYGTGTNPVSLSIGDFDEDGSEDLAVVNRGSHNCSTLLNNGDGTFAQRVNHGQGSGDSITGSTINSLVIRSAESGDGATDIDDPTVGGNVTASAGEVGIALSGGLPVGSSISVKGALTADPPADVGVQITGELAGKITIGDMTDKAIRQIDAGGDEGINGAKISIKGNDNQGLDGNLGGVWTDGGIIDTTIEVAGDLDPDALAVQDAVSTDWDDNGVGTITNTEITVGSEDYRGSLLGDITNNDGISGGKWPTGPAVGNFEDISSLEVRVYGHFAGSIISGGSIIDCIFWADPEAPGGPGVNTGRMSTYVLAFQDLTNITADARIAVNRRSGTPTGNYNVFAADAEKEIETLFEFTFPDPPGPTLNDGAISNLQITAWSAGIYAIIGNDLGQEGTADEYVGGDVEVQLTAGTGMDADVKAANNLTMDAVGSTGRFRGTVTAGQDAEVSLQCTELLDTTVEAGRHLTMPNVTVSGGDIMLLRAGILSAVTFRADTFASETDPGDFDGKISCKGNLHDFHILGRDISLELEVTPNAMTGQTGEKGDFLSGEITAARDIKVEEGDGIVVNNFGVAVGAGRDIIFGPDQVFRVSAAKLRYWEGDRFAGAWVVSESSVTAGRNIDVNFEFTATDTDGTLVPPPWYPEFIQEPIDPNDPDSEYRDVPPEGWPKTPEDLPAPLPGPPEDLHEISIIADNDGLFAGKVDYTAGDKPAAVFIANLNIGDFPDLAVANSGDDDVSIFINNGDGTFAPKVDYDVGGEPVSICIADLNGDTFPDLAVANADDDTVSILMNNGDGTFAPKVDYGVGDEPASVFIADLDGVNGMDLAVANADDDTVSILMNNGDGTFAPKVDYDVGDEPSSVFIADLNGDTFPDLAVANADDDTVSILMNNGDGTFAPKVDYGVGAEPSSIFIADVDGDTDPDLAVVNSDDDSVSILMNNGDGTFAPKVDYAVGAGPASVFIADLDGDGDPDMAVANSDDNDISILFNRGDGTFSGISDYPVGDKPAAIYVEDLNDDGNPDLVVANSDSDDASVLINIELGTLEGSISAHLAFNEASVILGSEIAADITLERLAGTDSDMDLYGQILAGTGGISGDINLAGDVHTPLVSGGPLTGNMTIGGNLHNVIFIDGHSTQTIFIGGNIANDPDAAREIEINGDCNVLHIGGSIGPGSGPNDTVFIHADSFTLLQIDGDVHNYVDILAGDEPGTGDIVTLVTGGFVVPEHLDTDGTMILQIRGNIINGGVPWPLAVGNRTVKLQLADAIGGGTLKIRVRNGSVTFFFMKSEGEPEKVTELVGVIVNDGTPSIDMKASHKDSDAVLGFLRAPAYQVVGADTTLFRSVRNVKFQNIDVDEITISGNARNIRLKNGNLEDCTIGDPDHAGETGIGNLNSLLLQGSSSRGTGNLTGEVFVLNDLTNKLEAVNATGSISIGGDARSIVVRRDLEAPIDVAGNVRNITANRDLNGINQPINIGGDLVTFKAKRGPFTADVEILGRLRVKFDMRGSADSGTRTINYDFFLNITTADYRSGGTLVVHDRVKSSRIR